MSIVRPELMAAIGTADFIVPLTIGFAIGVAVKMLVDEIAYNSDRRRMDRIAARVVEQDRRTAEDAARWTP